MQLGGALLPNYTTRWLFNAKLYHQMALQFQSQRHLLSIVQISWKSEWWRIVGYRTARGVLAVKNPSQVQKSKILPPNCNCNCRRQVLFWNKNGKSGLGFYNLICTHSIISTVLIFLGTLQSYVSYNLKKSRWYCLFLLVHCSSYYTHCSYFQLYVPYNLKNMSCNIYA